MDEMILPGVYITVGDKTVINEDALAEGGAYIGIVGTAAEGDINKAKRLTSFAQALYHFGATNDDDSLVKSLEIIFANGGKLVCAVRAAKMDAKSYQAALSILEDEAVDIVLPSGVDIITDGMAALLTEHLVRTEKQQKERIGIMGCRDKATVQEIITSGEALRDDSGRVVYVAPGLRFKRRDPATGIRWEETLSAAYTAAAVGGLLASLPVQKSPTNKLLNIAGLSREFNKEELETLVQNNVLAIENKVGFRVVKGISTSEKRDWQHISNRRISDRVLRGLRAVCRPFQGREKIDEALTSGINDFLNQMVTKKIISQYSFEIIDQEKNSLEREINIKMQTPYSLDFIAINSNWGQG